MAALSMAFYFSAIFGGAVAQFGARSIDELSRMSTLLLGLMGLILTLVFRRGFRFFNRVKINNTILLFMALWRVGSDGETQRFVVAGYRDIRYDCAW